MFTYSFITIGKDGFYTLHKYKKGGGKRNVLDFCCLEVHIRCIPNVWQQTQLKLYTSSRQNCLTSIFVKKRKKPTKNPNKTTTAKNTKILKKSNQILSPFTTDQVVQHRVTKTLSAISCQYWKRPYLFFFFFVKQIAGMEFNLPRNRCGVK